MQSHQEWMVIGIICASLVQIFITVESFRIDDKITSLPGQPQVSFQQFSGYISVDEKQNRALFYYFVEAESQPGSKPLVLWLNGGPGCSSVASAFLEHGPFKVRGDNLVRNEYNWNKEANMLYLESPAGVGFSYSANESFYTHVNDEITEANMLYLESPAGVGFSYSANESFYTHVNDEITARDNLIFLQRWFAKYPEYRDRDFFIAGESYAGHYVPQLAQLIIQSNLKINLKGIAVGNPLLDFSIDLNWPYEYYWSHGLISDDIYQLVTKVCNGSAQIMRGIINQEGSESACIAVTLQIKELTDTIDPFDVTGDICPSPHAEKKELVCGEGITEKYLNRKDVQKALHAKLVGFKEWGICQDIKVLQYDMTNLEIPTIGVLGSLVKSGIRAFVYSGDQDSRIPFTGSRTLVDKLAKELGLKTTVPYRVWFEGKQVGGWTQVYGETQLSFAIIRGASHTAPATQPARSFSLFKAFLAGEPLPNA
ncbi:serine carboxypeptidase-like 45 isoform X1 [Quercus robur]|uniref:serine carboxypeptidase-like 45 isoform X1 n=1 Tax=Quercus robur TaxID=38942 RepID=UPI002163ADEA|nr:serine carboxypeptidase-like 45 isoform X1 [Quercus robur]